MPEQFATLSLFDHGDVLADVFTFLPAVEQRALRAVNRATVDAFNHAVQLGFVYTGICAYDDPIGGPSEPQNANVRWFPITYLAATRFGVPGWSSCATLL